MGMDGRSGMATGYGLSFAVFVDGTAISAYYRNEVS